MGREPWYYSPNPTRVARGFTWRLGVWILLAVLFVGAISVGVWKFRVATSDVKGAGDAQIQINSGKNRIAAQETFEALYQQILTYDRNLDEAAKNVAAHPGDDFYATNYTGQFNICNDAVGQYNAAAKQVSKAKWLTDDLPFQIDLTNPLTNCRESNYQETAK